MNTKQNKEFNDFKEKAKILFPKNLRELRIEDISYGVVQNVLFLNKEENSDKEIFKITQYYNIGYSDGIYEFVLKEPIRIKNIEKIYNLVKALKDCLGEG